MVRIAPGGGRLALIPACLGAIVAGVAWLRRHLGTAVLAGAFLTVAGGVLAFHRDPERQPAGAGVLAPADGTVSVIREEGNRLRVGVYMSPTDVHVNRAPVAGAVSAVEHVPGGHWPAFSKDSDRNERVHIELGDYRVTLIAGAVARRIHPYIDSGAEIDRGDRIGHITFGSRADVLFPEAYDRGDLRVAVGETVRAGETVLADPVG